MTDESEFGWESENDKRRRKLRLRLPNEEHIEAMMLEGEEAIRSADDDDEKGSDELNFRR
jgi:hypothetical protein